MRIPRFRFTIRRMMTVVAIVAVGMGVALWLARLERLSQEYMRRTLEFSGEAVKSEGDKLLLEGRLRFRAPNMTPEEEATIKREIRRVSKEIDYYEDMRAKYSRAHLKPWLAVAPDPPKPN